MIYIIIVSHGHDEYIEKLLANLDVNCSAYKVIVRDNKNSCSLKELVYSKSGVHYISGGQYGFGHNNNLAAKYVIGNFNVSPDDFFLFLNPDIIIQHQDLINFLNYVIQKNIDLQLSAFIVILIKSIMITLFAISQNLGISSFHTPLVLIVPN